MPIESAVDQEDSRAAWPHCDQTVLHAPGVCVYCDHYPERQQGRIAAKIAFTGEPTAPLGVPDPATLQRSIEKINSWHGNVPMTPEQIAADDKAWEKLAADVKKIMNAPWWKRLYWRWQRRAHKDDWVERYY